MIPYVLCALIVAIRAVDAENTRQSSISNSCLDFSGMFKWSNDMAVSCSWIVQNKEQGTCSSSISKHFCPVSCNLCEQLTNLGTTNTRQSFTTTEINMHAMSMSMSMHYRSVAPTTSPIYSTIKPTVKSRITAQPSMNQAAGLTNHPTSQPITTVTISPTYHSTAYSTVMPTMKSVTPTLKPFQSPTYQPTSPSIITINFGSTIELSNLVTPIPPSEMQKVVMVLQTSIQGVALPDAVVKITKFGDISFEVSRFLRVLLRSQSPATTVAFDTSLSAPCSGTNTCMNLADVLFQNSTVLLGQALSSGSLTNAIISAANSQHIESLSAVTIDPSSLVVSTPIIAISTQTSSQVTSGNAVSSNNHMNLYFLILIGLVIGAALILYKKRKSYIETSNDVKVYHDLIQDRGTFTDEIPPCFELSESIVSPTEASSNRFPRGKLHLSVPKAFEHVDVTDSQKNKDLFHITALPLQKDINFRRFHYRYFEGNRKNNEIDWTLTSRMNHLNDLYDVDLNDFKAIGGKDGEIIDQIRSPSSIQSSPRSKWNQLTFTRDFIDDERGEQTPFSASFTIPRQKSSQNNIRWNSPYKHLDECKYNVNDQSLSRNTIMEERDDRTSLNGSWPDCIHPNDRVSILDEFFDASNGANLLNDSFQVESSVQEMMCVSPGKKRKYKFSDTLLL